VDAFVCVDLALQCFRHHVFDRQFRLFERGRDFVAGSLLSRGPPSAKLSGGAVAVALVATEAVLELDRLFGKIRRDDR
jgi:hypothetical protein